MVEKARATKMTVQSTQNTDDTYTRTPRITETSTDEFEALAQPSTSTGNKTIPGKRTITTPEETPYNTVSSSDESIDYGWNKVMSTPDIAARALATDRYFQEKTTEIHGYNSKNTTKTNNGKYTRYTAKTKKGKNAKYTANEKDSHQPTGSDKHKPG